MRPVQIWKDVYGYYKYLFCLTEVLNDQEGWYLKAYIDIPILYVVLSHV